MFRFVMFNRSVFHIFFAITLIGLAGSCTSSTDERADELAQVIRHEQLETFVRGFALRVPLRAMEFAQQNANATNVEALLRNEEQSFEEDHDLQELLTTLYAERNYEAVFVFGTQLTADGEAVMNTVNESFRHGFWPEELHASKIVQLKEQLQSSEDVNNLYAAFTLSEEEELTLLAYLRDHESLDETVPAEEAVFMLLASDDADNPIPRFPVLIDELTGAIELIAQSTPELELTIASAYLRYARDLRYSHFTRISEEDILAQSWDIEDETQHDQILRTLQLQGFRRASQEDGFATLLAELVPPYHQYALLQAGVDEYLGYVEAGGWEPIEEEIDLGSGRSELVPRIRERLALENYYEGDLENDQYDSSLRNAVSSYQATHQLRETGTMSQETWSSINRSADRRLAQILITLRRWRESRIGEDVHGEFIWVNIPDFHAELWDLDELVYRWRVIVGSRRQIRNDDGSYRIVGRTPFFSDELEYIVFNPYWNIPPSILNNEMLPELEENPFYFIENHIQIMEINESGRPRSVRQLPGPWNALGTVKFLFPNNHHVYMHDTPNRRLFSREIRAFSHGCIRVDDPVNLARILLQRDRGWSDQRTDEFITEMFELQEEDWTGLRRHIPVHLEYYSVRADENNRMNFLADIYTLDRERVAEEWDRVKENFNIETEEENP